MIAAPRTIHEAEDGRVREELEKILASQTFRPAEAQKKFLLYVVERTLEGRVDQIKEFAIGSDVFARGGSCPYADALEGRPQVPTQLQRPTPRSDF